MAGGIGSRFWPLSTAEKPKQFLDILGIGRSLLQLTYDRFSRIIPSANFLVVTSGNYKELVLSQLPELTESQVLSEPLRRNTAPCIAYATYKIMNKCPEANVIVAPSITFLDVLYGMILILYHSPSAVLTSFSLKATFLIT